MTNLPPLQVKGLPRASLTEMSATASPARGAEMKEFLQLRLQKNRTHPLVHSWDFWHDRQDRSIDHDDDAKNAKNYEARLIKLSEINDVRSFWLVFNNFDFTQLPLRDSVHLFHKSVKPLWEDVRNERGGSWTFRVSKTQGVEWWKELCMMAIGEQLQAAVESDRAQFRDDICGISLGVRFNSFLIQIWNRDAEHTQGIERILKTVLDGLDVSLKPKDGSYYYKKHNEHAGFSAGGTKD